MNLLSIRDLNHIDEQFARNRQKKLADICFVLNVEDTHIVAYALKKLVKAGYVSSEKQGKELYFSTTEQGQKLCDKYREVRETCLIALQNETGISAKSIGENAQLLRAISALYDNAARTAASL